MRNIEALRNYFLGKDPQLKETLTDNSLRLCGIEGKHYVLRVELLNRLEALKRLMDAKDKELQDNIDAEALTRSQQDGILLGKINTEKLAREGADALITNMVNGVAGDLNTLRNNVYTKSQVDYLINMIPKFAIEIVETLPTQDISATTIYLVPNEVNPGQTNSYNEYIYIDNNWEMLGTTEIDLSDYYTKEEVNAKTFTNTLTQDITIPENSELNPLLLSTGWWYTGEHVIYYGESVEPTIYNNALFYFNAEAGDQWFYFLPPNLDDGWNQLGTYLWFDNTDHIWQYSGYGVVTVIDSHSTDMSIPTAAAVHEFVSAIAGGGVHVLTNNSVRIWNLDTGVYKLPGSCNIYYKGATDNTNYACGCEAILVVTTGSSLAIGSDVKYYWLFNAGSSIAAIKPIYLMNGYVTATDGTWNEFKIDEDYEKTSNKVTSISPSSTDDQYPSAKLLYDLLDVINTSISNLQSDFTGTDGVSDGASGLVPAPTTADAGKFLCADGTWQNGGGGSNITYGTTDLTPGVSPLAEGTFYFCYE